MESTEEPPPEEAPPPTVFAAPKRAVVAPPKKRKKWLRTTIGMLPTAADFGSEADLVSASDVPPPPPRTTKWIYLVNGYFRAPMEVSVGPRGDGTPGHELHTIGYYSQSTQLQQPHIVGGFSNDWNYVGLAPSPTASLYLTATNGNVTGNVILAASTLYDSGYKDLDQMGGISQAYLTLHFPDLFGTSGGLAWTVGSFSNRYGTAGPNSNSTGYYGTYLFGRTHVVGEDLTADIDLSDHLELVLEHGFGAKIETIPYIQLNHAPPPPTAPYLPYQGPVPQGSNFVHHAHAALVIDDVVQLAAHYLTSWSPNDCPVLATPCPNDQILLGQFQAPRADGKRLAKEARLSVFGGEAHVDSPAIGHGYVGYSYIKGKTLLPLMDGIQVINASSGYNFAQNYFGLSTLGPIAPDVSGSVHTVLFQYMTPRIPVLGPDRDLVLVGYGMYNHAASPGRKQDKLKVGGEVQFAPSEYVSVGARFDRVSPDGSNAALGYSALSPRIIVHTNVLSKEYILLNYTRYFLGSKATPGLYNTSAKADPNLFLISAQVAF